MTIKLIKLVKMPIVREKPRIFINELRANDTFIIKFSIFFRLRVSMFTDGNVAKGMVNSDVHKWILILVQLIFRFYSVYAKFNVT